MNPRLRNILVVIAAIIIGSMVNTGIITNGNSIIPLPEGVDPTDLESMGASMHLYEAKHYIIPFLAHALGTLVGAFIAARFSTTEHKRFGLLIGFFFLIGGIIVAFKTPAPTWFKIADLLLAYLPMGLLGWILSGKSE